MEEDEMFGDFKFVSYPNNSIQNTNSSNNNNNNKQNDDDDWGDFITTPTTTSNTTTTTSFNGFFADTQKKAISDDDTFEFSRNFDSLNIESSKLLKTWEKPRGALPLSIFGDDEVEEEESHQASNGINKDIVSSKSLPSNFRSGVSFNDLIVNLYGENGSKSITEQIKVENGSHELIEPIKVENGSNSCFVEENGDLDEDDWEFKDAVLENTGRDINFGSLNVKKDENVLDTWMIQPATTTIKTPTEPNKSKTQESSEDSIFGFSNNAQLDGDWFVTSQGNSYKPSIIENGFNFESGMSTASIWNPDTLGQSKEIATENGYENEGFGSDESFGDFKDAFPKTNALHGFSEQKEELKIADQAGAEIKELPVNDEFKGNGKVSENERGALPLSIFSDDKLESDKSLFDQAVFSFKPVSVRNGINSQVSSSNLSLNDLISDLYRQAENIPSAGSTGEHTESGLSFAQTGLDSNLANDEDDFDESSWEFKASFSETKAEYSSPVVGPRQMPQKFPIESKMSFVDFYSRLKEESVSIILHHLDDLKNAQKVAALSGEDAKTEALHEEIQAVYKKLLQENLASEDDYLEEHAPRNICLNELLAAIEEPKFRILESEYHLSQGISLAEQNLRSAIALFEHAISIVKILNLGSGGGLFNYTTTWSRMVLACAQELKHGASIWNQLLQKNVHTQMLSKSQGQRYILVLGEIYRVTEVLRVSAAYYKPWILSRLEDHIDIFASLEECSSVWSKSGIDEALRSLSDPDGCAKRLLESIKSIHDLIDLDVLSLQNNVSLPEQSCRLSLLSLKILPDMEMVLWNGEHYFLKLANLWANLISCDPPSLPHIPVNL